MPRPLPPLHPKHAAKAGVPFVDILLNAVHARQQGRAFALEIGAGDGEGAGSFLSLYRDDGWSGLLVEPHPENFALLDALHSTSERVAVLNLGISDVAANLPLHSLTAEAVQRLGARPGRASLMRDRLLSDGVAPEDLQSVEVPFLRLDVVLDELGISEAQVLKVNAGGHETQVLASCDLSALGTLLVLVATKAGTLADSESTELLVAAGLAPYRVGDWLVGLAPGQLTLPLDDFLTLFGRRIDQPAHDAAPHITVSS